MLLAIAGITKKGILPKSLAEFSAHFCIAIAKSSVWMELKLSALEENQHWSQDFPQGWGKGIFMGEVYWMDVLDL